jgi:hypothetical protein
MSVLKCTFIQIFIYFPRLYPQPNRELKRIERVGKVAIMKQQIESMCISEALLGKDSKIASRKPYAARC